MSFSRHAKGLVALLGGLSAWGVTAGADGAYSQEELWGVLAVLAAALATWAIPNTPPAGQPADPYISETDPRRQ